MTERDLNKLNEQQRSLVFHYLRKILPDEKSFIYAINYLSDGKEPKDDSEFEALMKVREIPSDIFTGKRQLAEGDEITKYKSAVWLNDETSYHTGSIVCYDGLFGYPEGTGDLMYVEIGDCHQKVKIHKGESSTREDFVKKVRLMRDELNNFINYLESVQNEK